MKAFQTFFVIVLFSAAVFAQTSGDNFLQFKARVGFDDQKIAAKFYSTDGTKLTLIGSKTIQTWDVATADLVESRNHEIVQLDKLNGMAYEVSPNRSKVVTLDSIRRGGGEEKKENRVKAYGYDTATGKRIAVLERPDFSVRYAFWTADGATLVTFSGLYKQKRTEIAFWNAADLAFRQSIVVEGYTWHRFSPDGSKIYVGNGGHPKVLGLTVNYTGEGELIRAYNTRTGTLEKTFTDSGAGFEVADPYTFISPDGRYIAAAKDKNTIVWETNGKSQPLYELTATNGKNRMLPEGFSLDGKYLFIKQDGKEEYYDAANGQLANDVPTLVKLRRENEFYVRKFDRSNLIEFINNTMYRPADSVLLTPDGKYAVTIPCEEATVFDLSADRALYDIGGKCNNGNSGFKSYPTDPRDPNYNSRNFSTYADFAPKPPPYGDDVFRLSPTGNLLVNFRAEQYVVRDLKTGTILQRITRKENKVLQDPPRGNTLWDFQGKYALTVSGDDKSILIWEINEN